MQTTEHAPAARRWGPYGTWPAFVLVSVALLDGMEANLVPGILPLLQDEWGFGDIAAGAIPTTMAIAGLLVTLPAGYLADRRARTPMLALVVASWSVLTVASALTVAFWMFFATRIVLGTASHIDNPLAASLVSDYYPSESRARVFALQRAALYVGISIGVALGGVLGEAFGWRVPFLVIFAPGLVVAVLVRRLTEPPRGGQEPLGGDEIAVALAGGWQSLRADLAALRAVPSLRALLIGVAVSFAGFNGLGYWLPSFWERTFDLSEGQSAAATGAMALTATLTGSWIGGVLGDRLHRSRPTGRVELAAGTLFIGGSLLAAALLLPTFVLQLPLFIVAAVFLIAGMPSQAAVIADILPARRRGIGFALFSFLVGVSSAFGPLLVGIASDLTGSLRLALVIGALPCLPGAVVLFGARRTIEADLVSARTA